MQHWLDWIGLVLGQPGALRAVAVALVISWNGTQFAKNAPRLGRLQERSRRTAIHAIAFALAFVPALLLWPEHGAPRWVLAAAIGCASPIGYKLAARVIYRFWPWLEPKMSASPRTDRAER